MRKAIALSSSHRVNASVISYSTHRDCDDAADQRSTKSVASSMPSLISCQRI